MLKGMPLLCIAGCPENIPFSLPPKDIFGYIYENMNFLGELQRYQKYFKIK